MQKVIHRAEERGGADHGWLTTRHSFSFASWYEPTRMCFGALRVLNDDIIAPSTGFGAHPHRDMEIVTIVMKGTVTHGDSMGNTGTVAAGDVQVMSAGTGVVHSEENASADEPLALFQLWIEPRSKGITPRYAQHPFGFDVKYDGLVLLVSPDAQEKSLLVHQDAYISYGVLGKEGRCDYELKNIAHGLYLFAIEGEVEVLGEQLSARDAIGISEEPNILIESKGGAQILLIEVPLSW